MSMQLMSENLLENEIRSLEESGLVEDKKLIYNMLRKELEVIKRVNIDLIDMRGGMEEFKKRISDQSIYFMNPKEYEEMKRKANAFDNIKRMVNE